MQVRKSACAALLSITAVAVVAGCGSHAAPQVQGPLITESTAQATPQTSAAATFGPAPTPATNPPHTTTTPPPPPPPPPATTQPPGRGFELDFQLESTGGLLYSSPREMVLCPDDRIRLFVKASAQITGAWLALNGAAGIGRPLTPDSSGNFLSDWIGIDYYDTEWTARVDVAGRSTQGGTIHGYVPPSGCGSWTTDWMNF